MDVEAKQGASFSIKKTLRCSIRLSWKYASEYRGLFSLALLLYLLYKSLPGFFAFLISSSPVIICTAILLGILLSYGIKDLPEMDEGKKAPPDNSDPKFESYSRNVHSKACERFSVPGVKENTVREARFDRRDSNRHMDLDESVPLLKETCQGDDRVDAAGARLGKIASVPSTETMQQEVGMVEKDVLLSKDQKDEYATLFDGIHHSGVDENETTVREAVEIVTEPNHHGEVGDVSEHKAVDGAAGKPRWGRAFSVRRRKKLADIKIEAINPAVDNQLDYSLLSPYTRADTHDHSSGFDLDNAEGYSLDVSMTNTAPDPPVPDATETEPLLDADFSCPDPSNNDNSENHSSMYSQDSVTDSDSNDVAENIKAKEDGEEKKDAKNEPAFLWTADDEKNAMDLGYSEIERNRRLEILMVRRKSKKHMSFDPDGSSIANGSFRPQALAISARRLNPFADDTEVPGSAPCVLHQRKNPFDFLAEHSNGSDVVPASHNLNPQLLAPALHQDTLFKRHESFNFGMPQQREVPRFKPCFALDEFSFDEASASNFQRQFSDRSVSKLSVVSECDTVSSVGDPEHNEAIRNYIRGVRESSSLLRQDSDDMHAGNECSDGIGFGDNETLNAIIC